LLKLYRFYTHLTKHNPQVLVVRTPYTVTFCTKFPRRHIQVVLSKWDAIQDVSLFFFSFFFFFFFLYVLYYFISYHFLCAIFESNKILMEADVDCSGVAYNGKKVAPLSLPLSSPSSLPLPPIPRTINAYLNTSRYSPRKEEDSVTITNALWLQTNHIRFEERIIMNRVCSNTVVGGIVSFPLFYTYYLLNSTAHSFTLTLFSPLSFVALLLYLSLPPSPSLSLFFFDCGLTSGTLTSVGTK
jgi:hypothetical protein